MASTRLSHSHHSHGGHSSHSSHGYGQTSTQKSIVVAGVQDAYWSDDETEETECPLCVGELDIDDLNFRPCPCGYQICRFCFHHIKENLNGRCPACRRVYTDDTVEWKAMTQEDLKRLNQQKKQHEKERKELEGLKRAHLPNVRVVQRNLVYVTGIGPKYAKEELIPSLRSHEYFGQYGKINKIVLVKRNATATRDATVGLYITYNRREDAARAIAGVDGSPSPGGGGEVMRASYGTTKYCMNFLRNVGCTNQGCMELHEWGDDRDCFTKEDLATLKHTMKDTEHRQKFVVAKEADTLPRTASWGTKSSQAVPSPKPGSSIPASLAASNSARTTRTGTRTRPSVGTQPSRSSAVPVDSSRSTRNPPPEREKEKEKEKEKKAGHSHTLSNTSGSSNGRARSGSNAGGPVRAKSPTLSRSNTPAISTLPSRPSTSAETRTSAATPSHASSPASVNGPPAIAPLEVSSPISKTLQSTTSPPPVSTPAPLPQTTATSYQLSNQARALIDDVRSRREANTAAVQSPFPDLDWTLSALNDKDYSFSFNLDPKFVPNEIPSQAKPISTGRRSPPTFKGSFDPFMQQSLLSSIPNSSAYPPPPPGITSRPALNAIPAPPGFGQRLASSTGPVGSGYNGSFDPFADVQNDGTKSAASSFLLDDESSRRGSRFGFAQKKGSTGTGSVMGTSTTSSPLNMGMELLPQASFYSASDAASPMSNSSQHLQQWTNYQGQHDFIAPPPGISPLPPHAGLMREQAPSPQSFGNPGFAHSFGAEVSLKEMLNIGKNQQLPSRRDTGTSGYGQPFSDPAIMSMRMGSHQHQSNLSNHAQATSLNSLLSNAHSNSQFPRPPGLISMPPPPPGLRFPESKMHEATPSPSVTHASISIPTSSPALPASPILSPSDFPALPISAPTSTIESQHRRDHPFITPKVSLEAKAPPKATDSKVTPVLNKKTSASTTAKRALAVKITEEPIHSPSVVNAEIVESVPSSPIVISKTSEPSSTNHKTTPSAALDVTKGAKRTKTTPNKQTSSSGDAPPPPAMAEPEEQAPLLSRKAKKVKASKAPKPATASSIEPPTPTPLTPINSSQNPPTPTSISVTQVTSEEPDSEPFHLRASDPTSITDLLDELREIFDYETMSFFDLQTINPKSQLPLRYAPLVHALSALSVGNGTFGPNTSGGSIDSAVSSFQQLLETLTQTISDLLRLLPRATWDDSSSFDGVLRDMLKTEDFMEDGEDVDSNGTEMKDDEVAQLTLALERRARWMEMQLAKLEELHHDINLATVKSVLDTNDRGWGATGFLLPGRGGSLGRFEKLGKIEQSNGTLRAMDAEELEAALATAKLEEAGAEMDVKRAMRANLELL